MLKVRFSRAGAKKRPYYHIVVTNSESPRDGRFLEQIGTYDPKRPVNEATVDRTRLAYWVGVGARPSQTLAQLLRAQDAAGRVAESASR